MFIWIIWNKIFCSPLAHLESDPVCDPEKPLRGPMACEDLSTCNQLIQVHQGIVLSLRKGKSDYVKTAGRRYSDIFMR